MSFVHPFLLSSVFHPLFSLISFFFFFFFHCLLYLLSVKKLFLFSISLLSFFSALLFLISELFLFSLSPFFFYPLFPLSLVFFVSSFHFDFLFSPFFILPFFFFSISCLFISCFLISFFSFFFSSSQLFHSSPYPLNNSSFCSFQQFLFVNLFFTSASFFFVFEPCFVSNLLFFHPLFCCFCFPPFFRFFICS